MSYDVDLYSCDKPVIRAGDLPCGDVYIVNVQGPDTIDPEDIPEEILSELPVQGQEYYYFSAFTLEGDLPDAEFERALFFIEGLTGSARGLLYDGQDGTIERVGELPKPVDLAARSPHPETGRVPEPSVDLVLKWRFLEPNVVKRDSYRSLVECIEASAPKLLPRRYGSYEPPPYRYRDTGKEHLLSFLDRNKDDYFIWIPQKPFTEFHVDIPGKMGPSRRGFQSCCLRIVADKRIVASQRGRDTVRGLLAGLSGIWRLWSPR